MGYAEKMRKLCAKRGVDHAWLARRVGLSKSSMSRILNGTQQPKLLLACELAKALSVTLDYLVDDSMETEPSGHQVVLTDDEVTILKIVRRLGSSVAIDRLLGVDGPRQVRIAPSGHKDVPTSSAPHATRRKRATKDGSSARG
jgi:transcriptional regulator with XRE-family HTH domain